MQRTIGAVLAGLVVWVLVAFASSLAAKSGWSTYAAVDKQRAYTFAMLCVRLAAGIVATLAAGAVTAIVGRNATLSILTTGLILFLFSVAEHIRVWEQYPVWYHLVYLAYLIPLTLLGGRLVNARASR